MQIFEFVVIVSSLLCQLLQVYSAASDKSSTMSELHTISSNTEYVHMESMMTRDTIQRNIHIKPHPDSMHELTFAIKQNNADKLHDLLMERSTPGQPLYQQWMSNDEVRALTANPEASNALLNWFSDNGIMVDWVNRGQEYFRVRTRIGIWERLLRATFHEFQEEMNGDNVKATRAESYSLPASIAVHVEYVFGIVDLPVKIHKVGRYASDFDTWRNQKALSTDTETIVGATQFDTSLSFTGTTGATSTHNIHTKAIISGITFVQVNQFGSSNCATNTVFQSFDFAVGRCIPISIASGVSSIFINVTKSAIFLNTFSDSFCEVAVGSPQQLPSNGVCAPFNGQLSTIIASNGTKPPQPPFGRRNNINFIK